MKLTNRANKFSLTALAGLAVLSLTGAANADTTGGVSPTIGPFNTNFGLGGGANPITNLTLPTFDTTLGTLTGISFTVGGTVTTTFSGQDLSGNSNSITLTSSANISLYAPPVVSPATLIVFTIPSNSTSLSVAPNATFWPDIGCRSGQQHGSELRRQLPAF